MIICAKVKKEQSESAKSTSNLLVRHWREDRVLDALPTFLCPTNREEGYLIQRQIEALSDRPLFGWKIAATSTAGQRHIGINGPIVGRLLMEMVAVLNTLICRTRDEGTFSPIVLTSRK